jgi:hypothetical protein
MAGYILVAFDSASCTPRAGTWRPLSTSNGSTTTLHPGNLCEGSRCGMYSCGVRRKDRGNLCSALKT